MNGNGTKEKQKTEKVISLNKKAFHDYEISTKYEAGLVLTGTEVKSLRQHKASIVESYARVKNGEIWLIHSNIPAYKFGSIANHDPMRERKALLHRNEIKKITTKLQDKGFTLVPLKLYFLGSHAKVELGIARGKKFYDKRESIKRKDIKRRLKRVMSS